MVDIHELKPEQIPRQCFAHCPLKRFALVRISTTCLACAHHAGFIEIDGKAQAFQDRYRPLCGYPTARQIVMVEDD